MAADYLAGTDPRSPLASPLFADRRRLPRLPCWSGRLSCCSAILTFGSGGDRARVDVTLQIGDAPPHVYPIMLGTPEAEAASEEIGKFLNARVR